jgi:hypothetical protein
LMTVINKSGKDRSVRSGRSMRQPWHDLLRLPFAETRHQLKLKIRYSSQYSLKLYVNGDH